MNPGVFISHKVKDTSSDAFLDELLQRLADLNCHRWIDREIAAGAGWRHEIKTWMSVCSCAVILISKEALASDWMFEEASVSSWRQELDRTFKLFPVVLDGLTDKDVGDSRLKVVLDLLRIQSPGRNGSTGEKLRETAVAVENHLLARSGEENEYTRTARA